MWRIACFCGYVFEGIPPVACPACEEIVEVPAENPAEDCEDA